MKSDLPADLRDFLEKSVDEKLENFQVVIHDGNKKGEGFLGDFFFISLTNKKTKDVFNLAVKQVLACGGEASLNIMSKYFHNELCFYESLWPEMRRFQEKHSNSEHFLKVPRLYALDATKAAEKISLENLRFQGFSNHPKRDFFKKQHLEYVLRTYAQFHALSMAFRKLEPAKFKATTEPLADIHEAVSTLQFFRRAINQSCQSVLHTLDENTEKDLVDKFKVYAERGTDILFEISRYHGDHAALLHGDSWCNNLMFKYDESNNVEDMRIIDFQLIRTGTVVYDISYCIYSDGCKKTLDDLEHYLQVYHHSLSESLRGYDLDPEEVYPYDIFKEEWKRYSKLGLILGILCNSSKYFETDSLKTFSDMIDEGEEEEEITTNVYMHKSEKFLDIGRGLVLHMFHNDFL
ncbi:unnamed protein product [Phaedon cochleariae]|uniref:CHK kinase-like domain-containing protein n=1 Tax=Phaedon cochleariae TaxID=80249 RepID=A0A9P0GVH9_PHACE|nr:unnamed protein product [Phaedon cochleariae]